MKFKNENDRFEWEVLELNEEEYVKKINLLNPFKENQSFFNFTSAREKWNESVKGKRFIKKIKKAIDILNKEKYSYSDVISILNTLSSIATHIFIELEYYESKREKLKEFLIIAQKFFDIYSEILKDFKSEGFSPKLLNKAIRELKELEKDPHYEEELELYKEILKEIKGV